MPGRVRILPSALYLRTIRAPYMEGAAAAAINLTSALEVVRESGARLCCLR